MFDVETPFDQLPTDPVDQVPVTDSLVADLDWLPAGIMLASALSRIDPGVVVSSDGSHPPSSRRTTTFKPSQTTRSRLRRSSDVPPVFRSRDI